VLNSEKVTLNCQLSGRLRLKEPDLEQLRIYTPITVFLRSMNSEMIDQYELPPDCVNKLNTSSPKGRMCCYLTLLGKVYCAKVLDRLFLTLIFCAPIKL